MSPKLTVTVFLILGVAVISWLATVAAEEKTHEDKEVQIRELRGTIQELGYALEHNPNAEKAEAWRKALKENEAKLERLMADSPKNQKSKGEFPEIEMAIERAKEQLEELKQAAEVLQQEGEEAEGLKELQQQITQKEAELKELTALLKQRRAKKKKLEDMEVQIHRTKGAIQELKHALEHNPNSEKAETWKATLKENEKKLEGLMAEFRKAQKPRRRFPKGSLLTGWVISGTGDDVTIKTVETGKVMVLKVPQRRQEDGQWVRVADLARKTKNLQKEQLILAKYHQGEEKGSYFLQQIKSISFAETEEDEQAGLITRLESVEHRLQKIEDALKELHGR